MYSGFFRFFWGMSLCCLFLVSGSVATWAQQKSSFVEFGPIATTPTGWADFCQRYKADCEPAAKPMAEVASTDANMILIYRVNKQVNHSIKPLSDFDHWHEIDRWDYAEDGFGDCEDYALVKRRMLLAAGFPQSALLMTVVRDENMDGHAVLTIRTDRGDIVLDNMTDDLHLWSRVPYRFLKMQSQQNPNVWVAVGPNAVRPQISSR